MFNTNHCNIPYFDIIIQPQLYRRYRPIWNRPAAVVRRVVNHLSLDDWFYSGTVSFDKS